MSWVEVLRSSYNVAGIFIVGILVFLFLAGESDHPDIRRWRERMLLSSTLLAGLLLVSAMGVLGAKASEFESGAATLVGWSGLRNLTGTHVGTVWLLRTILAVPLCAIFLLLRSQRLAARPMQTLLKSLCASIALAGLASGTYAGHVAGIEPRWLGATVDTLHLIAIAGWLGALPALAFLFVVSSRSRDERLVAYASAALARFSVWAVRMTGLVVASGLALAYLFLKGLPTWFVPKFAWPDLLEIVLLLPLVAGTWHVRWRLFPVAKGLVRRGDNGPVRWGMVAAISCAALACLFVFLGAFPELVGTAYGRLLSAKIAVLSGVFAIAAHLRWAVLPRLVSPNLAREAIRHVAFLVATECALGVIIVILGSVVAETIPAIHDQIGWPIGFRYSIVATWNDPNVQWRVYAGASLILAGTVWGSLAWKAAWRNSHAVTPAGKKFWGAASTMLIGLVVTLTALAVPAFPDTYRRSDTPFEAVSVANGARLFVPHCTECHGVSGRGDGPGAARLPKKPANLTEPHTALHTAGDMFWWIGHGIRESGMPGFGAELSEEQRWDIVNFLRAFSTGYSARIIENAVVPNGPWLGAPDFDFVAANGVAGRIKDFRGRRALLVVFFSWPASLRRLNALAADHAAALALGAEVLAVPVGRPALDAARNGDLTFLPFAVVRDGSEDIAQAYALFGRTLAKMGDDARGVMPAHMEFLIDRFGYVRARWIAESPEADWSNLTQQLSLLGGEQQVSPFPDEHVH
jgi:putative copper export protein/mono/diheme cytochrome c family protein/peroxiredoxin